MQVCRACNTRFAKGLTWCPHCYREDWYDEDAPARHAPKSSDVRAWARENGIRVAERGALPKSVIEKYLEAAQ